MGFFNWAAPIFNLSADRWSVDDVTVIADWLRPAVCAGGSLLDVGGGTGALAARLASVLNARATVLDQTPQMLRYVRESERVTAVLGEAQTIPFADGTFDAALVIDALHHMREHDAAFAEISRVVRCGGLVLVLDLDREGPGTWFAAFGERLLGEPSSFLTPAELVGLAAKHGIVGNVTRQKGPSYRFLGQVR
jgi:ubiquinone/menaquinone biosynthesis C-methylase UbiE